MPVYVSKHLHSTGVVMSKNDTSEKILKAAMNLFSEKGYRDVTTREIARKARVSELTLFRHFGKKSALFDAAFDRYVFSPGFKSYFEKNIEWNLEKDLVSISLKYQEILAKNKKLFFAELRNFGLTTNKKSPVDHFAKDLKKLLVSYFLEMKDRGLVNGDPESLASNLFCLNFGVFMTFRMLGVLKPSNKANTYLREHIQQWIQGIKS